MGMAVGGQGELTNEPNLVPMIDVLLVLLVIFMLLVPMSRRIIDLQLPDPTPVAAPPPSTTPIVLEVLPGGLFRINTKEVTLDGLAAELHSIYDMRPEKIMFVKGDAAVKYQDVISAMDIARGAGVKVIGISPKDPSKVG